MPFAFRFHRLLLFSSRPAKVHLNQWSSFWGTPQIRGCTFLMPWRSRSPSAGYSGDWMSPSFQCYPAAKTQHATLLLGCLPELPRNVRRDIRAFSTRPSLVCFRSFSHNPTRAVETPAQEADRPFPFDDTTLQNPRTWRGRLNHRKVGKERKQSIRTIPLNAH